MTYNSVDFQGKKHVFAGKLKVRVLEKGGEPKVLENDLLFDSEIKVGKKTTRMKLLKQSTALFSSVCV